MQIKTPDQKLRVFISSTINELADERKLARDAVNKLKLTPILFELGARPHPPRDLYRSYLDQSHIFVGIYWNSYGWIAPDMEISGLEDEFDLSGGKPRLIYLKEPAPERQPRLSQLLQKIQTSESVCYQKFCTAEDLSELLVNDLAVLLSERFEAYGSEKERPAGKPGVHFPIVRSALIGRENELRSLKEMLATPEVGLVTVTGAGGTGKTRIALQTLSDLKNNYEDGVYFISFASIAGAALVPAAIASGLGLFDSGRQPVLNTVIEYLADKKMLLLLDNFEQVADAAFIVSQILDRCPSVKIVVTSRTPLHLRGEYVFSLSPLSNPGAGMPDSELLKYPAVQLFIQRAREVNPRLLIDSRNLEAIAIICKRLDGLPLAIELAAARTRFLPPVLLLPKMNAALDLLSQGPKDLPARQQTMRAAIDWSINLLDESQQRLFRRLSVFSDSWSVEASEMVANGDQPGHDVLEATEKLVDLGLVQSLTHEAENEEIEIRFGMLQIVKEYALEILNKSGELETTKKRHAGFFVARANEMQALNWASDPTPAHRWFDREYENLRVAFLDSLKHEDFKYCWQIIAALPLHWVRRGGYTEAFEWIDLSHVSVDAEKETRYTATMDADRRARAYLAAGMLNYFAGNYNLSARYLEQSASLYESTGNLMELGRAKCYFGLAKLNLGDFTATELPEAIELGYQTQDAYTIIAGSAFFSEALMAAGEYDKAKALLDETEIRTKEFGSLLGAALVNIQKGNLAMLLNQVTAAAPEFEASILNFDAAGFAMLNGWGYINLGNCLDAQGRFAEAREYLEKGLENARARGEKSMLLSAILNLSLLFFDMGYKAKAVKVFSAIEALKKQIDAVNMWSTYKITDQIADRLLRPLLADPSFANDVASGRKLTFEQLTSLVLEDEGEALPST